MPISPPGGGNGSGSGTGSSTPTPQPTLTPTPMPSSTPFNAAQVRVKEYPVPVTPLYVASAPDGDAYFGFGANGTGSNLYRFSGGALVQTQPAPAPNGYGAGGGVYGIWVTKSATVYWLSAYGGPSFQPYVDVECGSGAVATLCEPTVDEPTATIVDSTGTFWVGGLSFAGGGQLVTSNNAQLSLATDGVMQLLSDAAGNVWGVLEDNSQAAPLYAMAEFVQSGSSISIARQFTLPAGDSIGSATLGGDGAFWFTDFQQGTIGRITTAGALQDFRPSHPPSGPWYGQAQIATACDGSVWFSQAASSGFARIDATGSIVELALPTAGALPGPMAAPYAKSGCGLRELWVGEENAGKVAQITF